MNITPDFATNSQRITAQHTSIPGTIFSSIRTLSNIQIQFRCPCTNWLQSRIMTTTLEDIINNNIFRSFLGFGWALTDFKLTHFEPNFHFDMFETRFKPFSREKFLANIGFD